MSFLPGALASPFVQRALVEAVLVGIVGGVVGVHVILRRLPFLAMALGHATFPGVVIAALLGVNLFLGAGVFGALVVVVVALLGARERIDETSAIGVVLAGTFALGVLLLSAQAGFTKDLAAYLVGSIVTVRLPDLVTTAVTGVVVVGALVAFHKELVLGAFDRTGLQALGYPVLALDLGVLLLVELVVVTSVPAVGTILAVALLTAPATAARLWTDRLRTTMALAALFGAASGVAGVLASVRWDVAAGPAIVLAAAAVFALSLLFAPAHGLLGRLRPRRSAPLPARTPAAQGARGPDEATPSAT